MATVRALIVLLLLPGLALGYDCPVDPNNPGTVISGWPETMSPLDDTWSIASVTAGAGTGKCGSPNITYSGYSLTGAPSGGSFGASIAWAHTKLSSLTSVYSGGNSSTPYATCSTNGTTGGVTTAHVYVVYKLQQNSPGSTVGYAAIRIYNGASLTTACTPPPSASCEADAWVHMEVAADTADAAEGAVAAGDCMEGCTVKGTQLWSPGIDMGSGVKWSVGVQITGEACGAAPGTPSPQEDEGPDEKELCKTSAGGTVACGGPYGENCGYLNDKFVCLGKTDPDECWVNDDGSRWCGERAPTPPAPDTGTRGTKAPPNDTVKAEGPSGVTNNYNYYNTTTMGGSSQSSDSGANPSRDDSTDPSKEPTPTTCVGDNCGGEEGGGSGTGGAAWCDAPPTCSDAYSIYCAQLQQTWRTMCPQAVTESEALSAIGATPEELGEGEAVEPTSVGELDAVGPYGGAACPAPINVSIMGQSLSFDIWQRGCDMALLFAPIVMAMGYLMAGLLFVRGLN